MITAVAPKLHGEPRAGRAVAGHDRPGSPGEEELVAHVMGCVMPAHLDEAGKTAAVARDGKAGLSPAASSRSAIARAVGVFPAPPAVNADADHRQFGPLTHLPHARCAATAP